MTCARETDPVPLPELGRDRKDVVVLLILHLERNQRQSLSSSLRDDRESARLGELLGDVVGRVGHVGHDGPEASLPVSDQDRVLGDDLLSRL